MKLSDFNYTLEPSRIAKTPAEPRDSSKLLILDKNSGEMIDDFFYNLPTYLRPGDVIIRNNTKVIPARIFGTKDTGGAVEILLIKKITQSDATANHESWECITKPGVKPGQKIFFSPLPSDDSIKSQEKLHATVVSAAADSSENPKEASYTKVLTFNQSGIQFLETLTDIGTTPLPPYIADTTSDSQKIRTQYQTTYAKYEGSAAAPTAGLHFTKALDRKLQEKGVILAEVTLHVGLGTFLPVKTENILEHHMHAEWFELTRETAEKINYAKKNGNRVICVGTTSARVLESVAELMRTRDAAQNDTAVQQASVARQGRHGKIAESKTPELTAATGETTIFMYPGYEFKIVDGLLTNFHLPKSTLLMLVSALVCAPNTSQEFTTFLASSVGKAYLHAIENEYRFFSFGDAMLIM